MIVYIVIIIGGANNTKKSDIAFNNEVSEKHYLDIANRIVDSKPVIVTITGGEPLSVFHKIKSSIDLLIKNNIFVSINTNSTLVNNEISDYIKSNRIPLFVSLPCSNPEICDQIINVKGEFELIDKNIKKW